MIFSPSPYKRKCVYLL